MSEQAPTTDAGTETINGQPDATDASAQSATAQASQGDQSPGRSAEARELERQLAELRQKLKEAEARAEQEKARAQENLDRWQRAQADLANFRRRTQFERDEERKYGAEPVVNALLPVLDSFERAWQTFPWQLRNLTWLQGIDLIHRQLQRLLELVGVSRIEAEGQPFDPALHEAVDREEHEGPPHVVAVLQAGYKLHERVIRPALVKVGAKPAETAQPGGNDASQTAQNAQDSTPTAAAAGNGDAAQASSTSNQAGDQTGQPAAQQ